MYIGLLFNRAFLCFHLKCLFEISPRRLWRIEACLVAVIKQVTPVGARVKRVCPPVIRLACLLASGCILLLSVDLLYIILYTWFTPRLSSALRGRVQKQRDWAQCKGAFTWDAFCLSFLFNYYHTCKHYHPLLDSSDWFWVLNYFRSFQISTGHMKMLCYAYLL